MNNRQVISNELEKLRSDYSELFFKEMEIQKEKCRVSNRIISLTNQFIEELQSIEKQAKA